MDGRLGILVSLTQYRHSIYGNPMKAESDSDLGLSGPSSRLVGIGGSRSGCRSGEPAFNMVTLQHHSWHPIPCQHPVICPPMFIFNAINPGRLPWVHTPNPQWSFPLLGSINRMSTPEGLTLRGHENFLESLLKYRLLGYTLRISDSVAIGWGLRIGILTSSQKMPLLLVQRPH